MTNPAIFVDRADIRKATLASLPKTPLAEGQALVRLQNFALTTNNITYAATGDVIGYWQFFPTGIDGQGIVPVWGHAVVTESNSSDLAPGERLYGFFPMAREMVITPQSRGKFTVRDISAHRKDLPAVYNTYRRLTEDGDLLPDHEAKMALLYPLLATSYLLYDFLADNDWFGAAQIIIGSASSKTGLGLCSYLAENSGQRPQIVGLTAAGNLDFVSSLGVCDRVVEYGAITSDIQQVPSVYVDMAGNAEVRRGLHHHLADNMVYSCAVGTSHWDKFKPSGDLPGAKPRFFFAPTQIAKRREEWGGGVIEGKIDAAWNRVAKDSDRWMVITPSTGLDGALAVYETIVNGRVNPADGHFITL